VVTPPAVHADPGSNPTCPNTSIMVVPCFKTIASSPFQFATELLEKLIAPLSLKSAVALALYIVATYPSNKVPDIVNEAVAVDAPLEYNSTV